MKIKEITELEQQIFELCQQLTQKKSEAIWAQFEDFEIGTVSGIARLSSLFAGKKQMILIHNMGSGCPYCTMWADSVQGYMRQLDKDYAVVLVSHEPPEIQAKIAESRGWEFTMASDPKGAIADALGFRGEYEGKLMVEPGYTPVRQMDNGSLECGPSASFGPGDLYMGYWHLIAPFSKK